MGIALMILAILSALVGVSMAVKGVVKTAYDDVSLRPWSLIPLGMALLLWVLASLAVVPTRSTGVPTEFGKPTGDTYGAGLHWKAPWIKVHDVDSTVHTVEYKGEDCIYAKVADGTTACISMTYRWRIQPDAADTIYQDYRNSELEIDDAVRKALVSTNIKASINEALADLNPLEFTEDIDAESTPEDLSNIDTNVNIDYKALNDEIGTLVKEKIAAVGDLVEVQQITVSYVRWSDSTEKKIDEFIAAIQETRIAIQRKATAAADADANRILAASLSNDPNVLVSKCLDLLADGMDAPVGFQCWDGTGGAVVVPGTSK